MSIAGRFTTLVLLCLMWFSIQVNYSSHISVLGAHPNLSLVALFVSTLFGDRSNGAIFGFLLGLLEASYSPRLVGSCIVSRTMAGILAGALEESIFRDSMPVAALVVSGGTVLTECLMYLFAPQPFFKLWFARVLGEVILNAILAVPTYLVFRKSIRWKRDVFVNR